MTGQKYYYFHYYSNDQRKRKTTGRTRKWEAEIYIDDFLKKIKSPDVLFRDYASDFFKWGSPWILRQHAAGYSFSRSVADMRQGHLENHLIPKYGDISLAL